MPVLRNRDTWIPFYLALAIWLVYRNKWKGVLIVLVIGASTGLTDYISSSIVKPVVGRDRPCKDEAFKDEVHLMVHCGNNGSFTSSHAANHTAIAMAISLLITGMKRWMKVILFLWAASIGLAQIYVGVHYPSDILGGMILGAIIAWLVCKLAFVLGLKTSMS